MKVLNLDEAAERDNCSRRHLERLIARGEGPPIVKLGLRRIGVLEADNDAWLLSRRRVPPGFKEGELR